MKNHEKTPDAEPQDVEKKPRKTVAEIANNLERLRNKADRIRIDRENKVIEKVNKRESLVAATKKIDDQLKEAEKISKPLFELEAGGELKDDPELEEQIKAAKELIHELSAQQEEVNAEIASIEKEGDVLDKVWDEAKGQDVERTKKKEREGSLLELAKEAKSFADKINDFARDWNDWFKERDEANRQREAASLIVSSTIEEAIKNIDTMKSKGVTAAADLRRFESKTRSADTDALAKAFSDLEAAADSLGYFGGGNESKKIIRSVLSKRDSVFTPFIASKANSENIQSRSNFFIEDQNKLSEEYVKMHEKYQKILGRDFSIYKAIDSEIAKDDHAEGPKNAQMLWRNEIYHERY